MKEYIHFYTKILLQRSQNTRRRRHNYVELMRVLYRWASNELFAFPPISEMSSRYRITCVLKPSLKSIDKRFSLYPRTHSLTTVSVAQNRYFRMQIIQSSLSKRPPAVSRPFLSGLSVT